MRLVKGFALALAGALLIPALPAAQGQQDAERHEVDGLSLPVEGVLDLLRPAELTLSCNPSCNLDRVTIVGADLTSARSVWCR